MSYAVCWLFVMSFRRPFTKKVVIFSSLIDFVRQPRKSKERNGGKLKGEAESCSRVTLCDNRWFDCNISERANLLSPFSLESQVCFLKSSTW